ncbi:chemotaxis protein CheW [Hyphomonas sp. WL0036]|uniref:chemotaxis protein CheW n=1 Tax=Hyphomonas sediminis TaxID=2866160 RepID=UPI001C7FADD4|nr:chemotaxis protein CheW [Hyphomonas sediminis]MBY9065758.1 chemotaxis protein CheW [Hyphomonas sediminis]
MDFEERAKNAVGREFVAFVSAGQDYCVDIAVVREIRGWAQPTPMPHSPEYVQGLFNLRGSVIPIVDLAARLGLPPTGSSDRHVVIVVKIRDQLWGIVVDAVSDILSVSDAALQKTPDVGSAKTSAFVSSVISHEDRMLRMIDLEVLLPVTREVAA